MRTYAIGDIHGSLEKLDDLLAQCVTDSAEAPMRFVFLGDYLDRGPDSRGVVERLMETEARVAGSVCLRGNHEALALAALDGGPEADRWLKQGGDATLRSYGVADIAELPAAHVDWLRNLAFLHDDGLRLFVHAGVDPERPLDAQRPEDLIWIRQPFLSDPRDFGRLIVHGHTPIRDGSPPELRSNRLNLDTGAVYGGALSAAVFDDRNIAPLRFLQAWE